MKNRMWRWTGTMVLMLALGSNMHAQSDSAADQDRRFFTPALWRSIEQNIVFGGDLSLTFGSQSFAFAVQPRVGYKLLDVLGVGPGFNYNYVKLANSVDFSAYGPVAFVRFQPIDFICLQTEFEYLFYKVRDLTSPSMDNLIAHQVPGFLAGGGITQGRGKFKSYFMVLYNFLEVDETPYQNPVLRAGFFYGL